MTDSTLVELARDGDPEAFGQLTTVHHAELRSHCYRMLGSVQDAEDALQETLLRAWRGLSGFDGRGSVRSWLYSIATNAAIDITRHRSRRELPVHFEREPGDGTLWLEPYPDHWLGTEPAQSPEARYERLESIELAFLVALQRLPPLQRAVLLLRDVVAFSAAETATQLATSVPAVTSALQRARATMRARLPEHSQRATLDSLGDQRVRDIAHRYAAAIERGDVDALVGMLTKDATWCMPPETSWFRGHAAVREWLADVPLTLRWQHRQAQANGQLAIGCYLFDPSAGDYVPAVLDVLTLDGDKISAVTAFLGATATWTPHPAVISGEDLFRRFGLPAGPARRDR